MTQEKIRRIKPELTDQGLAILQRFQMESHPIIAALMRMRASCIVILDRLNKEGTDFPESRKYVFEYSLSSWLIDVMLLARKRFVDLGPSQAYSEFLSLRQVLNDAQCLEARRLYQLSGTYRRVPLEQIAAVMRDKGTVTQEGAAVSIIAAQFSLLNHKRQQAERWVGCKPTANPFKYVALAQERFEALHKPKRHPVKREAERYCGAGIYSWQDFLTKREQWQFNTTLRYWVAWRVKLKDTEKTKRYTYKGVVQGKGPTWKKGKANAKT